MDASFTFVGHTLDKEKGEVIFSYLLKTSEKTYNFNEKLLFPQTGIDWEKIPDGLLKNLLDNLLLILGISYWKLTCSKIEIDSIKLSHEQAIFWETVYTKGLGEFFYKNEIDFIGLVKFPYVNNVILEGFSPIESKQIDPIASLQDDQEKNRALLFFGGGKDSIVTGELLKRQNKNFAVLVVNPTDVHKQTLKTLGKDSIFFERIIDQQLFELNKQNGFYNGHVPSTAMNDFIGLLAAVLYGFKYLISSNEKSADFGNLEYLGQEINHQWSKTLEFELLFSEYTKNFISKETIYFSLLRQMSELKIAEIFSTLPDYFFSFSSCNKNFKLKNPLSNGLWCKKCPKCLFVFILLSAFLPKEKVVSIFEKNLYEDESLLPLFKELLGFDKTKPFECVGTPEEVLLALFLAEQKGEYINDFLMQYFKKEGLQIIQNPEMLQKQLLTLSEKANIPEEFDSVILEAKGR